MGNYSWVFSALRKAGLNIENGVMSYEGVISPTGGVVGPTGKGQSYFLDPANGSDNNNGKSPRKAFASLEYAYSKLTANQNDTLYYIAGATSEKLVATLTWAKSYTHFVGVCAPTGIAQRARLFNDTTTITTLLNITASGCVFKNFYIFQGGDDATELNNVIVTGGRNYFENVHFAGMGHATPADETGASSLKLVGAEENTFFNCTIGVDTIARSTTNAELEMTTAANRNRFINCTFLAFADNAGHLFVKIDGAGDIDRFVLFDKCLFLNSIESTATEMTSGLSVHNSAGGFVLLRECIFVGVANIAAADNGNVLGEGVIGAATSGLALALTQ